MLTEDFCSQEVFQLLREKGFPVGVGSWSNGFVWDGEGYVSGLVKHENSITHQMAMKWLREVYNIDITIIPVLSNEYNTNKYYIWEAPHVRGKADTYEAAVDAALKHSLENLI